MRMCNYVCDVCMFVKHYYGRAPEILQILFKLISLGD